MCSHLWKRKWRRVSQAWNLWRWIPSALPTTPTLCWSTMPIAMVGGLLCVPAGDCLLVCLSCGYVSNGSAACRWLVTVCQLVSVCCVWFRLLWWVSLCLQMTHHCLSAGLYVLCVIPIAMMSQFLPADDTTCQCWLQWWVHLLVSGWQHRVSADSSGEFISWWAGDAIISLFNVIADSCGEFIYLWADDTTACLCALHDASRNWA